MAESPEHSFLKNKFIETLDDFSALQLYGFKETDRKKFDFSCLLVRGWDRPLVGQVVWKHVEGMDKDIRSLINDPRSDIKAYILIDNMKTRMQFEEIMTDLQRSKRHSDLFKVKTFWVPQDFDADREQQRTYVSDILKSSIVQDVLFNVVFGHITANNIEFFLDVSGIPGLNLLLLYDIAKNGFVNISVISKRLGVSPGPVREKLITLHGAGFLDTPRGAYMFEVTPKGKLFLDILARLSKELRLPSLTPELGFILSKLGCQPVNASEVHMNQEVFPSNLYIHLVKTINEAVRTWRIELVQTDPLQTDPLR